MPQPEGPSRTSNEDRPVHGAFGDRACGDLRRGAGDERGQDRHCLTGGDERAQDQRVVSVVADVGRVAAEAVAEVLERGAVTAAREVRGPRGVLERGERDRAGGRGERVVGRDAQQHRLADQVAAVDVAVPRDGDRVVVDADDEVHRARAQIGERGRGL